jgi:hypothetical protein
LIKGTLSLSARRVRRFKKEKFLKKIFFNERDRGRVPSGFRETECRAFKKETERVSVQTVRSTKSASDFEVKCLARSILTRARIYSSIYICISLSVSVFICVCVFICVFIFQKTNPSFLISIFPARFKRQEQATALRNAFPSRGRLFCSSGRRGSEAAFR